MYGHTLRIPRRIERACAAIGVIPWRYPCHRLRCAGHHHDTVLYVLQRFRDGRYLLADREPGRLGARVGWHSVNRWRTKIEGNDLIMKRSFMFGLLMGMALVFLLAATQEINVKDLPVTTSLLLTDQILVVTNGQKLRLAPLTMLQSALTNKQ